MKKQVVVWLEFLAFTTAMTWDMSLIVVVPQVLRRVHSAYVDAASNPFFAFGLPISSQCFEAAVDAAVSAYVR